jgi:transposase-like protein
MTSAQTTPTDPLPICPLCHKVDETVTTASLRSGAVWTCTRCGQNWSASRLATAADYARFAATR